LDLTVKEVEATGRRVIARRVDVRDVPGMKKAVAAGVKELGHLDIVCANAGVCSIPPWDEVTPDLWRETLDINLTGVWNTFVATVTELMANGGGSIICTSFVML
jgi:NADP-dependent 3-hydroxy acid dehydrogenase YdfG